jgi:zinc protease
LSPYSHRSLTEDVIHRRLSNGLTLLIKELHAAPVVAIDTWVKVGYFNEEDDQVGISHVIEHMFFKGTTLRPRPDQIAAEVKALGGELNAGTYYDFTHYYFTLPAQSFSRGLEIQADALLNPLVDPEELVRELEAIIQESRRKLDNPSAFAAEKLYELAFRKHRIRRWRIGQEDSLRSFSREQLLEYYRRHYTPKNIILSVAGDISAARVIEEAEKLLGGLPAGDGVVSRSPAEPPQEDFRFALIRGDLKRAHLLISFRSAPLFHPDDFPARVLATVLGRGRSSRLIQEVKEKRGCVESVAAATEVFADLGTLRISAELDPSRLAAATESIAGVLQGIRHSGAAPDEIARARSAVESQYYFSQADVLGVAINLAYYEALGDYRLADEFVQRLQAVTPEAVSEVAERILRTEAASLLAYVPEEGEPLPSDLGSARALFTVSGPGLIPELPVLPQESRRAPRSASSSAAAASPRRLPLPGGATLLVEEIPRLPVTSVAILFRGGRLHETEANAGISRLALASMAKGTRSRNALRLAAEMESFGCSLDRVLDDDYLGLSIGILSRFLPGGLDLILDVIRNPTFPPEEVERERRVQLSAMESLKDQAMSYAVTLFREVAFPGHAYGLPPFGSPGSVQGVGTKALASWHASLFRPDRMVVAVAGDLSAGAVQEMLSERMAQWPLAGEGLKSPVLAKPVDRIVARTETRRKAQTFQMVGFPAVDVSSEDNYPLDLLQSTVSGLGGTFFEAIRGKRGLAYVVGASNMAKRLGGYFVVYLGTSPEKEEEAREILLGEVAKIQSSGIPEEEILRARSYILGTYPIALQTHTARALTYAAAEIQERGMEEVLAYPSRIGAVSSGQVVEVARRFLTPERYALGVLRGS